MSPPSQLLALPNLLFLVLSSDKSFENLFAYHFTISGEDCSHEEVFVEFPVDGDYLCLTPAGRSEERGSWESSFYVLHRVYENIIRCCLMVGLLKRRGSVNNQLIWLIDYGCG